MKSAKYCHQLPGKSRTHYGNQDDLGSNISDFSSDLDEFNLTLDRFSPVELQSAPAKNNYQKADAIISLKDSRPSDDSDIDYRIRGRNTRQKKSVAAFYPAPNHIMMGPRNYPASRFVKLHGASAIDPMAVTALAPYAMLSKVTKIPGLSDRLSLRSQLQSQTSTCDE